MAKMGQSKGAHTGSLIQFRISLSSGLLRGAWRTHYAAVGRGRKGLPKGLEKRFLLAEGPAHTHQRPSHAAISGAP